MKIRSKVTIGLLSSVMCVAAMAHAVTGYKSAKGPGDGITFTTKAIGGTMTIEGTGPRFEFAEQIDGGFLLFKANLYDLKTGMKGRDKHLQEVLKVDKGDKFKYATLKVKLADIDTKNKKVKGKAGHGDFSINNVTKRLNFNYDAVNKDGQVQVHAWFPLKLTKHGVEKICKLGVCVEDHIDVHVHFALTPPAE